MIMLVTALLRGFGSTPLHGANTRHIKLSIGSDRTLNVPEGLSIVASKKGVVHLSWKGGQTWTMTGVREGVVIIELVDKAHRVQEKTNVEVKEGDDSQGQEVSLNPCDYANSSCTENQGVIDSVFIRWQLLAQSRNACLKKQRCVFEGVLSEDGSTRLKETISALSQFTAVRITKGGAVHLRSFCDKNPRDVVQDLDEYLGAESNGLIHIECPAATRRQTFHIRSQLVLDENKTAEQRGKPWENRAIISPDKTTLDIKAIWDQKNASRLLNVIAEPEFFIEGHGKVELKTGGEIPVRTQTEKGYTTTWKEFGMQLEVKATPMNEEILHLQFILTIRTPSQDDQLSLAHLQGQLQLPYQGRTYGGSVNLESNLQDLEEDPWLAHIPLIGFLFRHKQKAQLRSKASVWFEILSKNEF
jgi:hypothetical protein